MSKNDARPFVDLKKDAQEFRSKFDEDIEDCLNFLDAKITSLICDPDSFENSRRNVHQNALAEFSKAKYDIFINVKSLINAKEREWLDYIGEMKKLFIENVEIFLAGTKLEVKLPPPESAPSYGPRKSPGNRKSNPVSVTRSIYPIISSFTKNISGLGSSLHGAATSSVSKSNDEGYEMDVDDEPVLDRSRSRSSSSSISERLNNSGLNTSRSSSGRRNSLKKEIFFEPHDTISTVLSQTDINDTAPVRGKRGKLTKGKITAKSAIIQNGSSADENEVLTTKLPEKEVPLKGRRGRVAQKANISTGIAKNSSSTDENEVLTTELPKKEMPLKGRRGRVAQKAKPNKSPITIQLGVFTRMDSSTEENENLTTELPEKQVPLKGRRGRAAQKAKENNLTVIAQSSNSTDEIETVTTEMTEKEVPLKGRRGRAAKNAKTTEAFKNRNIDENNDLTDEIIENEVSLREHQGKLASKAKTNDLTGKKAAVRGRKSVKSVLEKETYKAGPPGLKKVPFSEEHSSSDELDIQTPLSRPVKSAARRKTLLPNLEVTAGADIIPGITSRAKGKRKTIGGVSELESTVPSKRLKGSQKSSSQEEDSSADNLLESDGNYTLWMDLSFVDGKVPSQPAVYELKVYRAKNAAYIGSCENLRHKLTLYNLRQNSGHKHLDKFIDRNHKEIQVRYEIISSFNNAKQEAKNRIEGFKAQHKNPPAYN